MKSSKAEEFKGCGLKKCPFRKADRDRIAWNGKVRGDTVPRYSRPVNGRQVFATMPLGAFYVEDRKNERVIFAGEMICGGRGKGRGRGVGQGRFGVLYWRLGAEGTHRMRIRNRTDSTDGTYTTLSAALTALWLWVRQRQTPGMVIVEGEVE